MLMTEWNNDDALAVWKEEWRERFLEEGERKGLKKGEEKAIRSNILVLRDVLTPEVLAEKLQVPLDYVLQIQQEANKEE